MLFQAVKYVICYMAIEECRLLQENVRACDTELLGPEAQGFLGWLLFFFFLKVSGAAWLSCKLRR